MIIETIVLPVVQKVLTSYITSVMTKRSTEKTRADLVSAVREELQSVSEIRDEVKALHAAVTELDIVVKTDRTLDWRSDDDALVIRTPRHFIPRPLTVDKALHALQQSVAERRKELGLPEESDLPEPADAEQGQELDLTEESDVPEPVDAEPGQELDLTEEPDAPEPPEAHPTPTTVDSDSRLVPPPTAQPHDPIEPSAWQKRVLALSEDTRRERRQRLREGK